MDLKTYADRVQPGSKAGDFDMAIQTFSTDPSPSGMRQNWGTAGIGPQGQNFLRYSNPKTDALIDSVSASFDPVKVKQYAKRAFQQIADDAPGIWLYDLTEVDAVNRRINVTKTRADGWWHSLAEWSIAPDKRIDRDRIPLGARPLIVRRRLAARLGQSVVVVFIVTTIAFFVIRSAPGDPFSYDSTRITPAVRAEWRARFGYDQPLIVQYGRYLWSVGHGHLGYSTLKSESVATALAEALPRTLALAGLGLLLSFVIGVVVGTVQAARRGGWFDRITSYVLLVLYSIPDFWGALIILLVFAYWWQVFPAGGMVDAMHDYMRPGPALTDRLKHLVLPLASIVLLTTGAISRFQRGALLEVLPADYVRTARAKGVPESTVIWKHALRTALAPMIVLLGIMLPAMLGGTIFVEQVFSWPGMGLLAAHAIGSRDYDLVTATVIVGAVLVVVGNIIADALHVALDPRVRE